MVLLFRSLLVSLSTLLLPFDSINLTVFKSANLVDKIDPCNKEDLAYMGGEELVYKLYYNWNVMWIPAGEVTFSIKESVDEYEVVARGKTYASYEWFYKVDDYYRTVIEKRTMLPRLFERDIHEGNYKFYNRTEFDQLSGKVISYDGKNKHQVNKTESIVSECMHDMMSIIYHLRNVQYGQLKKGDRFPIKIFLDQKPWQLNVLFGGRERSFKIKDQGVFHTLKFSPQVIEGHQFKKDTQVDVWVSDDLNKVPLLIESPLSVGSVKAVLKSHKGLKHNLTAKVK